MAIADDSPMILRVNPASFGDSPTLVDLRPDWAKLSASWTKRIRERIAELERLEAGLTDCIGCGCLSLDRCRFVNPSDRAARQGEGLTP